MSCSIRIKSVCIQHSPELELPEEGKLTRITNGIFDHGVSITPLKLIMRFLTPSHRLLGGAVIASGRVERVLGIFMHEGNEVFE